MRRILLLLAPALVLAVAACASSPAAGDGAELAAAAVTSRDPAAQRKAIVATARTAASGNKPAGKCYAAVARYIDTVGYGAMKAQLKGQIGSLPSVPYDYGVYAHQFADYANEPGHADLLGLTRLLVESPYDAPAGAIVVVRAGAPGTSHPTAGDISIAAGSGVFYNDGEMSYGDPGGFPSGNDFVLGVYVPKGSGTPCTSDTACNGGAPNGRVCGNEGECIVGCHSDLDCSAGTACDTTLTRWSCR